MQRFIQIDLPLDAIYQLSMQKSKLTIATLLTAFLLSTNMSGSIDYNTPLTTIDNDPTTLGEYEGKLLLIVNVASKCGFTGQYEGLEALYKKYKDNGLVVLGFPCNQFGSQEPGNEAEIKSFCSLTYGVSFPLFSKIDVNGQNQHPLYASLTGEGSPFSGKIKWNFSKFLVSREGEILDRFGSMTGPQSKKIVSAIEAAL